MQQTTSTTEVKPETIVAGPNKFELMLALFDHTMSNGRTVAFTVTVPTSEADSAAVDTIAELTAVEALADDPTDIDTVAELAAVQARADDPIEAMVTVEVAINEVGRESGDGESWIFKGYIPGTDTVILDGGTRAVTPGVEGYYNTRHNQGWLKRGMIR